MYYSPLRYPGGKNKLSSFIGKICIDNNINGHYIEPYSGGAAVALFLLIENFVKKVTINDKDRSIYAFWYSVLNYPQELCELINSAHLNIEEWIRQREIQKQKEKIDLLTLGFSTFYLNRTNRSGIINGGVMGGRDQTGKYLMDCRFNRSKLISRIKKIANKKNSIELYNIDAIELIDIISKKERVDNTIFYFDPPYYLKASTLYMNHYEKENHHNVSEKIKSIRNFKWIVSYDNVPEIRKLYSECPKKEFSFKHTAYEIREGKEILFFSKNLKTPTMENWNPLNFKYKRDKPNSFIIYQD